MAGISVPAEAATSRSINIDDRHTLYLITFSMKHDRYALSIPTQLTRTINRSITPDQITFATETPEGLTSNDGIAIGTVFSTAQKTTSGFTTTPGKETSVTLAVLHQKAATSSRTNTVAIRHLPFLINNQSGTTTSMLARHELKQFVVSATGTAPLPRE